VSSWPAWCCLGPSATSSSSSRLLVVHATEPLPLLARAAATPGRRATASGCPALRRAPPLARLAAAARCDGDLGPPRRVPLARHVLRSKKLRTKARPEKNHEENEHAIQTLSQKYSLKTPRIKTKLEQ